MLLTEYNESEERELFRQEVLEEGREEEKREAAKKMLDFNMDIATISAVTGLSSGEIAALRC